MTVRDVVVDVADQEAIAKVDLEAEAIVRVDTVVVMLVVKARKVALRAIMLQLSAVGLGVGVVLLLHSHRAAPTWGRL